VPLPQVKEASPQIFVHIFGVDEGVGVGLEDDVHNGLAAATATRVASRKKDFILVSLAARYGLRKGNGDGMHK
jgi:hypothetical protein